MKIVRPVTKNDLEAFEAFAFSSRYGITNLPKNHQLLEQKVNDAVLTFQEACPDPFKNLYIFVMEDSDTGLIVGTSAIYAKLGGEGPLYYYEISHLPINPNPKIFSQRLLKPIVEQEGPSELCALYLMPHHRHGGLGRLMSLSRLLFIADHPDKFTKTITADMRGVIDENGRSPFWEGLGRKFYDIPITEVFELLIHGKSFIPEFLPHHSISLSLLSAETQAVIGQAHEHSRPGLKMLQEEGFHISNRIDIFDGGPTITAEVSQLRCVKDSKVANVVEITKTQFESEPYLISNRKKDFRCCTGSLSLQNDSVTIQHEVADELNVEVGDQIRYIKMKAQG